MAPRQDVDPFDEARAVAKATELYRKMREEEGKKATAKEIYQTLGYSERQYYRMFEFLELEPVVRKVEKKVSEDDESLPHVADFTQRELAEYAPLQTVYKDNPEKLEELITQTIDVKPSDRKMILEKLKESNHPSKMFLSRVTAHIIIFLKGVVPVSYSNSSLIPCQLLPTQVLGV